MLEKPQKPHDNLRSWLVGLWVVTGIAAFCIMAVAFNPLPGNHHIYAEYYNAGHEDNPNADIVSWFFRRIGGFLNYLAPGIGAVATVIIAWFTRTLWKATNSLLESARDQGEAMQNSIAAAARAATAMEDVAKGMAASVENARIITDRQALQMRAYVFPVSGNVCSGATVDPPQPSRINDPFLILDIRNSGPTPAYKVDAWAWISVIEPSREDTLIIPPAAQSSKFSLGGYQNFPKSQWLGRYLTQSEIDDISIGVKRIYYYGRINYRSLGVEHTTNFRLYYYGEFPPKAAGGLLYAEDGNESD